MQVEKLPVKWFCANLKLAKKHPQYIWLIWLPEQLLHWISLQTWVRNSHQNIQKQHQFCIIQVSEFPFKIFNVLGAALLHFYWLIFATAEPEESTQTLHTGDPKFQLFFSKDSGNSLGKSQQQHSQTDQPERTQLSCTMKTQLWLFAELWCCNWQRPGQACPREFQCHAAVPVPECPTQSSRSTVMPSPSQCWTEDWTESKIFDNGSLLPGRSINFISTFLHKWLMWGDVSGLQEPLKVKLMFIV